MDGGRRVREHKGPNDVLGINDRRGKHMPLYEYVCIQCQSSLELRRPSYQRRAPVPCCECGSQMSYSWLKPFATVTGEDPHQPSMPTDPTVSTPGPREGSAAIHVANAQDLMINNVSVEGFDVGVSLDKESTGRMTGLRTKDVGKAVERRDE